MSQLTALIADRDATSRQALGAALAADYRVVECEDFPEALRDCAAEDPDLVVLTLGTPLLGGLEMVRRIRTRSDVPLVALGPDGDDGAAVRTLDLGADDYLPTTSSPDVLLAHARAVLRRLRGTAAQRRDALVVGDVTIDFDRRRLFRGQREITLRPTEWHLLAELATNTGRLLSHEELLTRAWGPEYRHDRSYLRVGIRRLRDKLEDDSNHPRYIRTIPGRGYLFEAP
jgi:two-component system KDP operon response regulator KdpE